jgi:hypothetical protein
MLHKMSIVGLEVSAYTREGEFEYLHHSPASRRRRWKGNPVPGDINMGTWPFRLGETRIWDSKIWSWVLRNSAPRMTALGRVSSICKRQVRHLVREGAPHQQAHNCLTVIKIWSRAPSWCFTPRQKADWPSVVAQFWLLAFAAVKVSNKPSYQSKSRL